MDYSKKTHEFESLKNDVEKWDWIKENADIVTVWLDNDDTFATFDDCNNEDSPILQFNDYLGNGGGIEDLLSSIGIKSSGV